MKFSIRDLMLVTVIVAILAAWAFHNARWIISERMHEMRYLDEMKMSSDELARLRNRIAELEGKLPNSSAPAPNPTNP